MREPEHSAVEPSNFSVALRGRGVDTYSKAAKPPNVTDVDDRCMAAPSRQAAPGARPSKAELSDQVSLTSSFRRTGLRRARSFFFRAEGAVQYVRYSPIVPAATADQRVNR